MKFSFFTGKLKNLSRMNIFIIASLFVVTIMSTSTAGILFYVKSAQMLTDVFERDIIRDLEQVNEDARAQIALIDSFCSHLMLNVNIRDNLDPAADAYGRSSPPERKIEIERQLSLILIDDYLWGKRLVNALYIFGSNGEVSSLAASDRPYAAGIAAEIAAEYGQTNPTLAIRTDPRFDGAVFFVKNVFSSFTGRQLAAIVINADKDAWMDECSSGADETGLVMLFSGEVLLAYGLGADSPEMTAAVKAAAQGRSGFQDVVLAGDGYFLASDRIDAAELTSVVAVPKEYALQDLREAQSELIAAISAIALLALLLTVFLSVSVTSPIKRMTEYVRDVSLRRAAAERPKGMFREFDEFAEAFSDMLKQLEIYYNDLHEQRLLLKTAEIKALQAQISPHFLFNVLNTIVWKAQICGNSEIYRMVLSLSELLRANILSIDKAVVTVKEELDYARLYIYLQQQRFEGKIDVEICCDGVCEDAPFPRFCIQPLVENAVEHGFEPLPDDGSEKRLKIGVTAENGGLRVRVEDNGAGLPDGFALEGFDFTSESKHTHIGLKNLNRRLILLGGPECRLTIESADGKTAFVFWLPEKF